MPTVSKHLYVSHQIEHLASGRLILHGEEIDTDDLEAEDERLHAHLVPIEPPVRKSRRSRSTQTD